MTEKLGPDTLEMLMTDTIGYETGINVNETRWLAHIRAWQADRKRLKRFGHAINIAHHGAGSAFGELSDQDWAYLATLAPQGPTEAGKEKP